MNDLKWPIKISLVQAKFLRHLNLEFNNQPSKVDQINIEYR